MASFRRLIRRLQRDRWGNASVIFVTLFGFSCSLGSAALTELVASTSTEYRVLMGFALGAAIGIGIVAIVMAVAILCWPLEPDLPQHNCQYCGYDLRGSFHSRRCPECGRAF